MQVMSETVRLGKNSLWLVAARIAAQALALFSLLLARKLGSVGFGEYAFFTTVVFIGNIVTTCGTDLYLIREIAARDALADLPAALWIQLVFSALFIAGAALVAPFVPNQSADSILALQIYSLTLIPLAFYSIFTTALRGKQRMDLYALLSLASALVQALVIVLFLLGSGGVVLLAILLLGAQVLVTVLAGWFCVRQVGGAWRGWGWRFSWPHVRTVLIASAALGVLGVLGMLYQKAGLLLLSTLSGAALTGWYAAVLRVLEASKLFHVATLTALYPLMAKPSGPAAGAIQFSWKVLLAGAFALALGLSLLAAPVVDLLYGAEFAPAAPILHILAWALVPYAINSFLTLAFVARNRTHTVVGALTASLVALALLSLWWIPLYGLEGAAWAALSAEALQAILLLSVINKVTVTLSPQV
jgi:O-antigen/teichoic acid export membrane protein